LHCSIIRLDDVSSGLGPEQIPALFLDNLHAALARPAPHDAAAVVYQVPHPPPPGLLSANAVLQAFVTPIFIN